ncbi:MAG: PHP domain-containing protein [Nitrospira sp.]|nr:PHP domain-containing protein [bacterium]MBL7047918.1 PHP domain-containing protein [Nitrospira sp.]
MIKKYTADLHIHTCLSPCADLDMTPSAIVAEALKKKIDIIAITDHNSAENILATQRAAAGTPLTVLAGMEVATSEEAHVLALFDQVETAIELQNMIYQHLLPGENDEKLFGEQIVVNEKDEVINFNKRILIAATALPAHEIINSIHALNGLVIASHVDKSTFSIISQLGFIPADLTFDALEISPHMKHKEAEHELGAYRSFTWISSSDAHYLRDLGRRKTSFFMEKPSVTEMKLAMRHHQGRRCEWS